MSQINNKFIKNGTIDLTAKVTGALPIVDGGTGQTTQTAAFDALSPATTKGDTLVYSGTHNVRLPVGGDNKVIMADSTDANGTGYRSLPLLKNFISNPNFESNTTTNWSLGTTGTLTNGIPTGSPTFGSGASGNLSISSVSSGALSDTYSLSYASSAATTAGNMLATAAFTIDAEFQAKVLTFKFAYSATVNPGNGNWSGTSSNSFGVAIYDVTNSAWISPAGAFGMTQSSGVGICTGTFQTSSSGTQYRLVIYNANATSGAITVLFDDFYLGPQTILMGTPITDWQAYTPTTQGLGTVSGVTFRWRRVGGNVEISGSLTSGTNTGVEIQIGLPNSYTSTSTLATLEPCGVWVSATSAQQGQFVAIQASKSYVVLTRSGATASNVSILGTTLNNTAVLAIEATVPVTGFSSNVQMSSDTDTRVIVAKAHSASASGSTSSPFIFGTVDFDTAGMYNSSTGKWTVPVSGFYRISGTMQSASANVFFYAYVNGTQSDTIGQTFNAGAGAGLCYGTLKLNAGDTVEVRPGSSISLDATSWFTLERVSGPSVVAASETVAASYYVSANFAAGTTTPINFDTKIRDTHGAVTTSPTAWKFTAPISGTYNIGGVMAITAGSATNVFAYKNGSSASILGFFNANYAAMTSNMDIQLNAGDYIDIRPTSSVTFDGGNYASTGANSSVICIKRVGN